MYNCRVGFRKKLKWQNRSSANNVWADVSPPLRWRNISNYDVSSRITRQKGSISVDPNWAQNHFDLCRLATNTNGMEWTNSRCKSTRISSWNGATVQINQWYANCVHVSFCCRRMEDGVRRLLDWKLECEKTKLTAIIRLLFSSLFLVLAHNGYHSEWLKMICFMVRFACSAWIEFVVDIVLYSCTRWATSMDGNFKHSEYSN